MGLIENILKSIEEEPAADIRVGLRYTAVRIKDKVGLAYTFPEFGSVGSSQAIRSPKK